MSRRVTSCLLPILLLLPLAGCKTDIRFANMVPDATVENIRWEPRSSDTVYSAATLKTGETSKDIPIMEKDAGETGTVAFDLVVEGNRLALVARQEFTAVEGETSTFTLTPEMKVYNPLLEREQGELASLLLPRLLAF